MQNLKCLQGQAAGAYALLSKTALVYTARNTFVMTARAIRLFRRLLNLLLVAAVLAASGTWAAVDLADRMEHVLEQAQTAPEGPAGEHNAMCKHGCIGHLAAHLSGPLDAAPTADRRPATARVASTSSLFFVFPVPDSFFRPPRTVLG